MALCHYSHVWKTETETVFVKLFCNVSGQVRSSSSSCFTYIRDDYAFINALGSFSHRCQWYQLPHCSLSSAVLHSVILCLPDVFLNLVTLAILRSSSAQSSPFFSMAFL